jgi:hypothetical protein
MANSRRYADAPDLVVVLVAAMAPKPPSHMSTFFVVGVIGLARPTNVEDGLRWWDLLFSFWSTSFGF